LLDAISRVSSVPTQFGGYPAGWRSVQLPDTKIDNTFLASFGRPERLNTCSCERSAEPSVSQALNLSNGATLNDKLRADSGTVAKAAASNASDAEIIDALYRSALSRFPREAERETLLPLVAAATKDLTDPKQIAAARRQAIEDLYWATLTSNEFLFNH